MRIVEKAKDNSNKIIDLKDLVDDFYDRQKGQRWTFKKIKADLLTFRNSQVNQSLKWSFANILHENFEIIIKALPYKLSSFIRLARRNGYQALVHNGTKQTPFGKEIEDVFNYKGFRKSSKGLWYAQHLNIKTCLYCNTQYTLVINKENGKDKALLQLDHFFAKSRYPYLSISMFNLIPSCANCNKLKGDIEFNLTNAIHPYYDDMNRYMEFDLDEDDFLDYFLKTKKTKDIKIKINKRKSVLPNSREESKVDFHIQKFGLSEVYEHFSDIGEELLFKAYYYNSTRKEELQKLKINGVNLFTSYDELNRFILGNYTLDSEINNRTLAKLMKDIAEKLKIII